VKSRLAYLITLAVLIVTLLVLEVYNFTYSYSPVSKSDLSRCLTTMRLQNVGWNTIVTSGSSVSNQNIDLAWNELSTPSTWSVWAPTVYEEASFSQPTAQLTLNGILTTREKLGFPFGTSTLTNTIKEVDAPYSVTWTSSSKGVTICTTWSLTQSIDGTTVIKVTRVFDGTLYGIVKPIVNSTLQNQAQTLATNFSSHLSLMQ
jgi:hypothetical protein